MVQRVLLVVLIVLMGLNTYFTYAAYTTIQAQAAKITALENHIPTLRSEVEARVRRGEDAIDRIRGALPGR